MNSVGRGRLLRLQAENGVSMLAHRPGDVFQGLGATETDGGGLPRRHAFEQKFGLDERKWTDFLCYI